MVVATVVRDSSVLGEDLVAVEKVFFVAGPMVAVWANGFDSGPEACHWA